MARNVNDILFRFLADTKSLNRGTKDATKQLGGVQKGMAGVTKVAGAMAAAFAATRLADFAGDAIQLAVSAEEVDEKFRAVFGTTTDLTDSLREWGDLAGVTEQRGKDLAATFGNLAIAQGLSKDETENLTLLVAELAGDMASFNDQDPEQVFFDLNKALLTTEREGMKKYGIALTETEIKQRALDIAVADGRTEFTKGDKALASYQLTLEQAGKAVGDLERTSSSTANQQRQLAATFRETQEELGRKLLPAYADLVGALKDVEPILSKVAGIVAGAVGDTAKFATSLSDLGDETASVEKKAGDFVSTWLRWFTSGIAGDLADSWDQLGEKVQTFGAETRTTAEVIESRMNPAAVEAQRLLFGFADAADTAAVAVLEDNAALRKLEDSMISVVNRGGSLIQFFRDQANAARNARSVAILLGGGGIGGGRDAQGGTIQPGDTHLVGEKGPELITPRGGARITPSHMSGGGGGGTVINVEITGAIVDPTSAAEQITDLLEQYTRTNVSF